MASWGRGFIAFIDLLGFRKIVEEARDENGMDKLCQRLDEYAGAVADSMTYDFLPASIANAIRRASDEEYGTKRPSVDSDQPVRLNYVIFSDCIVIYESGHAGPGGKGGQKLERLIRCCSQLSYALLELEQPFRGCIAAGNYCVRPDPKHKGVLVVGQPLLDAYKWEQRLQWIGIVMHPTVLDQPSDPPNPSTLDFLAKDNKSRYRLMCHRLKKIPLRADKADKAKTPESLLAILPVQRTRVPNHEFLCFARRSLESSIEWLESLRRRAEKKKDIRKYDATIKFYRAVQQEWSPKGPNCLPD